MGLGRPAIDTLVERTTGFTLLRHLPRVAGHGQEARVNNGPALAAVDRLVAGKAKYVPDQPALGSGGLAPLQHVRPLVGLTARPTGTE